MIDLASLMGHYSGQAHRVVESQEKAATLRLVDTLDEQAFLEELIEETKTKIREGRLRHYLIHTPFRYPPLKHGSRFGRRFEPSIFYAGATLDSALAEAAYYSFYFMSRSVAPFESPIINHKTSFSVDLVSPKHVDLTQIRDEKIQQQLTHVSDYTYPQRIGTQMREEGCLSFSYHSARKPGGINIGVFTISVIKDEPDNLLSWEVKQTPEQILFFCPTQPGLNASFSVTDFLVNGQLPRPGAQSYSTRNTPCQAGSTPGKSHPLQA